MIDFYHQAGRDYWSALPALLVFAVVLAAVDWFLASTGASMGTLVAQLIVLYYFHRNRLFGEPFRSFGKPSPDAPPQKFRGFMMISLALLLFPFAISVFLVISIRPQSIHTENVVFVLMLYLGPLYFIVLSIFGTALPASVARPGNFQMSKGVKATFGTMWRLILGPGVATVAMFGLLIAVEFLLGDSPTLQSTVGQMVFLTLATMLGFFPSLLGVVVLCHMYHLVMGTSAENPDIAKTFS
jgi:hypothetical protein